MSLLRILVSRYDKRRNKQLADYALLNSITLSERRTQFPFNMLVTVEPTYKTINAAIAKLPSTDKKNDKRGGQPDAKQEMTDIYVF